MNTSWGHNALNIILSRYEDQLTRLPSLFYNGDDWVIEWQHCGITAVCFYAPDDEQNFGELLMHDVRSKLMFTVDEKFYDAETLVKSFESTILPCLAELDV